MLGQTRDLISVRGPDYFVYRKQKNTISITLVTVLFLYLFSLLVHMFTMWFMKLLLLLRNSCRLIFGSMLDICNKESIAQICIWNSFHNSQITPTFHTPNAHYNLQILQHWCKLMYSRQTFRRQGKAHMDSTGLTGPGGPKMPNCSSKYAKQAETRRWLSVLSYPNE